jgi:malonate transporter and related proteins
MATVLSITIPIFLLIATGYCAFRFRIMEPAHVRALGGFVLKFALPALIIRALSTRRPSEIANTRYLLIYGIASLAIFGFVFLVARLMRRRTRTQGAIQALGAACSNSGFIGYPVAALVLGAPAGVALSLNMAFENIVLIPLALGLAESGASGSQGVGRTLRATFARLVRNPLIIAIAIGAALAFSGVGLPGPATRAIDLLANAAGAVALFAIGGSLVGLQARGLAADVGLIVAGKLVLHPLLVFAGLSLSPGLDPDLAKAMMIFASVPMITIYPLIGASYGEGRLCAAALVAATALSFVTISGLLYLM